MDGSQKRARSYRDLDAWRESVELAAHIYRLTESWPKSEQYGLVAQVRRASTSVPANIAEGQGRLHRGDFVHHLSIARGSLYETESHLFVARRLNFIDDELLAGVERQSSLVARLLNGLIRSQRTTDRP